jgi:hypothetical protein
MGSESGMDVFLHVFASVDERVPIVVQATEDEDPSQPSVQQSKHHRDRP